MLTVAGLMVGLMAGCSTVQGFALGREYLLVQNHFFLNNPTAMPCDRIWVAEHEWPVERGWPLGSHYLVCQFDGIGPTPIAGCRTACDRTCASWRTTGWT